MAVLDVASPLVPSVYELLLMLAGLLQLVLFFGILFWLPRQSKISSGARLVGLLVAFLVPILGPIVVWGSARSRNGSAS